MTKADLEAIFDRVRAWPAEKQEELLELVEWLDDDSDFFEIPEEALPGIERGLAAIEAGDIVPEEEMAAFFANLAKGK